jgi:CO dehydrogenase/acetyl-CoA synthase alpha subunit
MNDIPSTIKVISYEDKQPDTKKVYKIINTITDEIYVGVTEKSLKSRLYYHKRDYNKP